MADGSKTSTRRSRSCARNSRRSRMTLTVLTAPLQTFVALGGNDANDGLTPSTPKLTIQAMLDWLKGNIFFGNSRAYVNVLDPGGYAGFCVFNHWAGGCNNNLAEPYLQAPVI